MFRRFLIALLFFALPLQAALASSRWLCVALSQDVPKATVVHEHAQHGDAVHDHGSKQEHDSSHGNGDGGCSLCAACTVTAATPPAQVAFAAVEASQVRIPSLEANVPRMGTGGPERPNRTI